jgi:hypothetical protein
VTPLGAAGERTKELAPGWTLVVEEATRTHWVGACRDVALAFAYEGSHEDTRHVYLTSRVVERLGKEAKGTVKLLFVLPLHRSRPPEASVRSAVAQAVKRLEPQVARTAVVVLGTGFGAAIHRSAIAGILALLRTKIPIKVVGSVREGLAHLVDAESGAPEELARTCEALSEGPPAQDVKSASAVPGGR